MAKAKGSTKAKAQEVDEDLELEELDEDVTEDEAPAKAKKTSKIPEITFGVKDLAEYLSKKHDKVVTTRELRAQIRRMVRDDSGRVDREITPGNRTRYDWKDGLKDPEVKAIIKAYADGEPEVAKKKALEDLKNRPKKDKKGKGGKKGKAAAKAAAEAEAEDDDDDLVDDDD